VGTGHPYTRGVPPTKTGVFAGTAADNQGNFAAQDWVLFVSVSVIWGASFLLIAESLEAFTPGMVTLLRVGLGAVTLWGLRLLTNRGRRIEPQDRARVAAVGIIWVAVPFTLFPLAQQWINSAVTGLLNGATPVLVALVSAFLVRVVPHGRQLIGLGIGFVGIVFISLGSAAEGASQAKGVALVLLATVCYGFAMNMAPPLQAKYGAVVLMSAVLTVATVCVVPYAMVNLGNNDPSPQPILAILVLGAVGTGFAYWIMMTLVGRVGSIRASVITYLIPVVALALGVLIRQDSVNELALIGTPVTILGAVLSSRRA